MERDGSTASAVPERGRVMERVGERDGLGLGWVWIFNGLGPLTEAVTLRMTATENTPINRGDHVTHDRLY